MRRWFAIGIAVIGLLGFATFDSNEPETEGERVQRLHESFACPTCDGQSVAESNAAVAAEIRSFVSDEVAAGSTDTEIRDSLITGYTSEVLLNPPSEGFSVLIWILPVVVAVLGVGGLVAVIRRGGGSRTASIDDAALVAEARQAAHPQEPGEN